MRVKPLEAQGQVQNGDSCMTHLGDLQVKRKEGGGGGGNNLRARTDKNCVRANLCYVQRYVLAIDAGFTCSKLQFNVKLILNLLSIRVRSRFSNTGLCL